MRERRWPYLVGAVVLIALLSGVLVMPDEFVKSDLVGKVEAVADRPDFEDVVIPMLIWSVFFLAVWVIGLFIGGE